MYFSNKIKKPSVKSNINLINLELIKNQIGNPYGSTLIALTLLDKRYRELKLEVKFNDINYMEFFIDGLIEVWKDYKPVTSKIRSFKYKKKYLDKLGDIKLLPEDKKPLNHKGFCGCNFLIDINRPKENEFVIKLTKWSDKFPRILKCKCENIIA